MRRFWQIKSAKYGRNLRRKIVYKLSLAIRRHRRVSMVIANGLLLVAVAVLLWGIYTGYKAWHQQAQAKGLVADANQRARENHNRPSALSPHSAPSTVPPAEDSLDNYHVAPQLPRILNIPKLGVKARVLAVGLARDGSIGTPSSVFDTAWYDHSSLPGQAGAMLIDGHISSWTTPGVFYHLNELRAGDTMTVERGDGTVYSYTVVKTTVYDAQNVDMSAVLNPIDPSRPGLNLISCYGSVIHGTNDFDKRVVVFASQN